MKKFIAIFICTVILATGLKGQAQHTKDTTLRKNTFKIDITSHWLYRNSLIFSYERVVKPNQTFALSGGLQQLRPFGQLDSINVKSNIKASGYKIGGEYRFYLKKENKYAAPHGVYIGPYFSILNFNNKRSLEIINNGATEYADLKSKVDVINVGVQLGYQFVLNNRWTIDMIFIGPSISNYRADFKLDGNFTIDPDEVRGEIVDALIKRFPGLDDLITDKQFTSKGRINNWAYGFRYQLLVGYHFGKKKK